MQGGEQKTHTVFFEIGSQRPLTLIPGMLAPLIVYPSANWVAGSGALPYFSVARGQTSEKYFSYIDNIVEGDHSFFAKREIIDEYGWRNFGDTWAKNERLGS